MSRNIVSKISNAFATGGGGVNFEQQIQAMFLLSLLLDGFCPAMNEQTKRVCFQAKHMGYDVDDLVVFTYRNQSEGKLLCQVKHSITISENDTVFQDVICAAWNDFKKADFDKKYDRIALATAQIAYKSQQALRFLHSQALGAVDENDFLERVNLPYYSNSDNKTILSAIKNCIHKASKDEPTAFELWEFCRVFTLLLFDLDYAESINRTLAASLIKNNSSTDASLIWARLVEYAGNCNQTAASIDLQNIDKSIAEYFSDKTVIQRPPSPITKIDMFVPYIALIGAWREDNMYDRKIVEKISGIDYAEFEAKARSMVTQDADYLRLTNGRWTVLHKEILLEQCSKEFFDDCLKRLFEASQAVFEQKSKRITSSTPYFISSTGEGEYDNSNELRKSLASSMCWIKKSLSSLSFCNHNILKREIICFVGTLLDEGEWATWASLRDCLQNFAELAPDIFFKKLEWNIIHKPEEILKLFPQKNGALFGQPNYISELLWSLEILAWSPDYLISSIRILAQLETLPYEKTNWTNTPVNSIISILLPWYPQTMADIEKRKNALRCLSRENATVFWNVITKLLPNQTSTTTGNPKPKYLSLSIPEEIEVTKKEVYEQYCFNLELAVEIARNEIEKLSDLAAYIMYMDDGTLVEYLDCIDNISETTDESNAFVLWLKLRECMALLKPDEDVVVYQHLERIQLLVEKIEPHNICLKYQELYLGNMYLFDEDNFETTWEMLEQKKSRAVKEIFDQFGISEVEAFGHSVNNIYDVAYKLGYSLKKENVSKIIDSYYSGDLTLEFLIPCLNAFSNSQGSEKLLETSLCQHDPDFILEILSKLTFSREMIKVVDQLLPDDDAYWETAVMPYCCRENGKDDLKLIYDKLVKCRRYITAINIVGRSSFENVMGADDIYDLLKLSGTEESIGNEKLETYSVRKLIGWLQQQDYTDLELLSDIEFIYLPLLDDYSEVQPRALNTRLSQDPDYFCSMIELFYKKSSDEEFKQELNKEISERLFEVLFQFKVVPGTDWNGNFNEEQFMKWIGSVKIWSTENDRYAVTMQTVGSGLSYATVDDRKMPANIIIEELNKAENEELRRGYYLGIINQRGVHLVDPEGKPELELAKDFEDRANRVETMGYSRYSDVLRKISEQYKNEASYNIQEARDDSDIECDLH